MMASPYSLGGRLALLRPADLSADQRQLYDLLQATELAGAKKAGFEGQTAAGEPIGPFNAMLRSPEIATAVLGVVGALGQHSALSEPVRQVVILTVGAAWRAAYELYAHTIATRNAGLPEAAIQRLAAGLPPQGLPAAETLAHEFTHQLLTTHQVADELYQRGIATFGEKGVFDLLALAGQYRLVSAILQPFAVPAPGVSATPPSPAV